MVDIKYSNHGHACNVNSRNYVVPDAYFTREDADALNNAYAGGSERVWMSDLTKNDKEARLCFQSKGLVQNRLFVDALTKGFWTDHCVEKVLTGEGGKAKCDALAEVADRYAETTWYEDAAIWLEGAVAVAAAFGPGMKLWHGIVTSLDRFRGGGPKGGSGAGGGSGLPGVDDSSDAAPLQRSMADYALAGAALVGLSIAIGVLVADDITGVGVLNDPWVVPLGVAWTRFAAVLAM